MLLLVFTLFAILATLLCFFLDVAWYWLILIFIGSYLITVLLFVITLYIITLFYDMKKIVVKPKRFFGATIYHVCVLLKSFLRIKIISEGFEKLKGVKGYAMVCNHQAIIDPIVFLCVSKDKNMSFIMKEEVRKIPLVGRWLTIAGHYYLNRNNPREGLKTIINGANALKADRAVGIYVEGTRSKGTKLGEFHEGSFKMPQKSKAPIALCVIDNTYKMAKNFPWKRTKVYIKVCEVLSYENYEAMSTKEISDYAYNVMSKGLEELRDKYKYTNL